MASIGLVLSGGGVRGAYQVGVLRGIVDVLGLSPSSGSPFSLFAGTSIGAVNTAYAAANAERGDLDMDGLSTLWSTLDLDETVRVRPLSLLRDVLRGAAPTADNRRSLVDPEGMVAMVDRPELWEKLHRNIDQSVIQGLFIATLEVATGKTAVFADLAPGLPYQPSRDPRRICKRSRLSLEHLLASTAVPLLLPARRIDGGLYVDGGLRFNTPISPVIRAGAEKLVVVSTLDQARPAPSPHVSEEEEQSLFFLAGKLMGAAMLDPLQYDLVVLDRINALMGALEETLEPAELEAVAALLEKKRGSAYRRVDTLLFMPSEDIGLLAARFIKRHAARWQSGASFLHRVLRRAAAAGEELKEADWATYVLFDGAFCGELIDLGWRDVHARAEEVRAFFG